MESLLSPDPLVDGADLPEQWKRFVRDFELFLVAVGKDTKGGAVKVALLLRTIGPRGNDIYSSFKWENETDKTDYAKVKEKYEEFCAPRVNTVAMTHKLLTTKQGRMTIDEYVTELHNIARQCDLNDMYDRMVLQGLLLGVESTRTQTKLFEKTGLTLDQAIDICRAREATGRAMKTIDPKKTEEEIKFVRHKHRKPEQKETPRAPKDANCTKCGQSHPPRKCPAFGKRCHKCKGYNHYEKRCKSKRTVRQENDEAANQMAEWNYSTESEDSTYLLTATCKDRKLLARLKMRSSSVVENIEFQCDTGATSNILNQQDYQRMGKPPLQETKSTVTCYNGSQINPLGWCYLHTTEGDRSTKLKFLVIDVDQQHSLLSLNTCLELGLVNISESLNLTSCDDLEPLLSEYEDVFSGVGHLPGEYKIELDPKVRPVRVRPRKVALTMKADVESELKRLESEGIISKVQKPTDWISHMQPVRKPSGAIRICIDPQNLNRAIRRNHTVMPTLDDVLPQLNAARYFSLCDAKQGFLQVKLAESSTDLTTFWTPKGRYKFLRMPFGISSAPEEFQRRLADSLQGLEGVCVVADDILIFGQDRSEHDKNLKQLLGRARDCGLKLNREKSKFLETELPYIGHILTTEGVKPDPRKISAILEMPAPTTVDGVKRFLGHVTYMAKFLPNLSAESEPLRRILQQKIFSWDEDQKRAFQTLKGLLTQSPALQYFDVNKPVIVQTDASTAGLGATLLQDGRPVTYVSRSLTLSESNYAPIELEAMAIVFALTRLDQYVFGHTDLTVHTDHKPLIPIFQKPIFKASRRVQSMLLSLQRYAGMKLVWRPGREQFTADLLSRDSKMETPTLEEQREHVLLINDQPTDRPMSDKTYQELRKATASDSKLQLLISYVMQGWPDKPAENLLSYSSFKDEISVEDGVLYKGTRAIVPGSLQSDMLDRLHSSHQGVSATLRRARLSVYWPKMNQDVTKRCLECRICLRDAPKQQKEELRSHHIPVEPWSKVGIDLFELECVHYVVVVDYTSDYFEYLKLPSQRARDVISRLKEVFSRFGIPRLVHTDNAAYFTSTEFSDFSRSWKFDHSTSSPHHHQSNGKVEAAVKISKRILRRCSDPFLALLDYRNTQTEGMSTSPVQRLIGRSTRTTLPQVVETPDTAGQNHKEKIEKQRKVQVRYNKAARDLPVLTEGQPIMVRDYHQHKREWKEATVVKRLSGRSYSVDIDGELYRRNRHDLRPAPGDGMRPEAEAHHEPENHISDQVPAAPNPVQSEEAPPPGRPQRIRTRPVWTKDYVCDGDEA